MKLDIVKARIIRHWFQTNKFTIEELAKIYDVTEETINNCINNKTFKEDGEK